MLRLENIRQGFLSRYPDRIVTLDSHTQGEPTRLVVGGIGDLPGNTIKEKRDFFESRLDHVRKLLTREPRGHRGIMAAVATEPTSPEAAFGLFYMDARRYPYLCGHATIGAVASLIETGALEAKEGDNLVVVDTPSGPLPTHARVRSRVVESVALDMVPSFVLDTDVSLDVPGFGTMNIDLVCEGGFFAMVSARSIGIELVPENSRQLIPLGMEIIEAANRQLTVHHPERPEVKTVDVTEFYDDDLSTGIGKNAVVYGESHMDRSPCGTGTTAKMTLLHHKGRLATGRCYKNSGPLGTVFEGRIVEETSVGPFAGVVVQIRGSAQISGFHQFVVDPNDPFPEGFLL